MLGEIWAQSYVRRPLLLTMVVGIFFSFNKHLAYNTLVRFANWQAEYQARRQSISLAYITTGVHAYLDVSLRMQELLIIRTANADTHRGVYVSHAQAYETISDVFLLIECLLPGPLQSRMASCPEPSQRLNAHLNSTLMAPVTVATIVGLLIDVLQLSWFVLSSLAIQLRIAIR